MTISGTSRLHERHSSSADVSPRSTRSGRARSASSSASPHAAAPRTSKPSSARCRSRKPRVAGSGSATRTAFGIVRRRYPRASSRARCPLRRLCDEAETTIASATPTPFSALPYAADVPYWRATVPAAAAAAATIMAFPAASAPGAWQDAAPMPDPRGEVAAARVGDEIAVVGGFERGDANSARVDAYSPARDTWRRLPDLPVSVDHAMAAATNGRLYVLGGYGRLRAKLRSAWVLPPSGGWRVLPPLPAPRAAGGGAVVRGRLY